MFLGTNLVKVKGSINMLHYYIAFLSLGNFFYSASFKVRYVVFFALMTPLGIAIGTVVTEINRSDSVDANATLVAVLQTLASGTLLYVAFFEVDYHFKDKK